MQGHRRRRATQRSPATPISPKGGGGTASISLSLLLHDAQTSRRRRFANSTPSRSPQMLWYSWDETLGRSSSIMRRVRGRVFSLRNVVILTVLGSLGTLQGQSRFSS